VKEVKGGEKKGGGGPHLAVDIGREMACVDGCQTKKEWLEEGGVLAVYLW